MNQGVDADELRRAYAVVRDRLLAECRSEDGGPAHWTGELSTSPLSTAVAAMALRQVLSHGRCGEADGAVAARDTLERLIDGGLVWLAGHQNDDGGWGDTVKSSSNISTTMLCHAVFHATESEREDRFQPVVDRAKTCIDRAGGVPAVVKRYGKDKTFSVPILTHCALAGLVDWSEIPPLPFELAWLPAKFYSAVKMPVVSYALPALIAIGQVRHHFKPTWNPVTRVLRNLAIGPTLNVLERIQPPNGGFLEATPLTGFVTMSLAGMGLVDHPVVRRGVSFLVESVRPDGSWPIDTDLATWVTTLSVNALGEDVPEDLRPGLIEWLLGQQYREVHPYTNAAPGGWAWTNLPGGVPDADDTPGAMLAMMGLTSPVGETVKQAVRNGGEWLRGLQNRDGGFPTFCRGWGTLPFDRSSPDISAHCLRALARVESGSPAIVRGLRFLEGVQRPNGSWVPLWFGNEDGHNDENPVYGTSRVLMAFRDLDLLDNPAAQRALDWLASVQHPSGGWGGDAGIAPSVEETALAAEVLLESERYRLQAFAGIRWLIERVTDGSVSEPSPIGFYFARLWYFERLYPVVFAASALRRAVVWIESPSYEA